MQITSAGIRSLLTGPFRDSVEVFPFYGWSICHLDNDGFQRLAREFPCNKFRTNGRKLASVKKR